MSPYYSEMSGCGLAGIVNRNGEKINGKFIYDSITSMKERGNGMGAGFAAYGIYPEMADYYAFHVMLDDLDCESEVNTVLNRSFKIVKSEIIPTKEVPSLYKKTKPPVFYRYFVEPRDDARLPMESEEDLVVRTVMTINEKVKGAYVISSGKNMGAFKGVGHPDEIGDFFEIKEEDALKLIKYRKEKLKLALDTEDKIFEELKKVELIRPKQW
jgi:glutamate synthase domain-containing protein 1